MRDRAPCLILPASSVPFAAWNEDGRMIQWSDSWHKLDQLVRRFGYDPVPANSRCGRTIMDKIRNPLRYP